MDAVKKTQIKITNEGLAITHLALHIGNTRTASHIIHATKAAAVTVVNTEDVTS